MAILLKLPPKDTSTNSEWRPEPSSLRVPTLEVRVRVDAGARVRSRKWLRGSE